MRSFRVALALLLLVGCGRGGDPPEPALDARLAAMDLRSRAAQLVIPPLEGVGGAGADMGGVLVTHGDAGAIHQALRRLHATARVPPLVVAPLDSGIPVHGATPLPAPARLAATASAEEARRAGVVAGREAREVGIDLGVIRTPPIHGSEPLSPLARNPERTAAGLGAYLEGAAGQGLAVAVQTLWSEEPEAPLLVWDRARLHAIEIPILERLLRAGAAAVVPGAVRLPAITGDSTPLPLSPAAVRGLLRRDLGWTGPVAVDLGPESPLVRRLGVGPAAVRAVAAGADLLLGVGDPTAVLDALVAAVAAGDLRQARIAEAAGRVLALKAEIGAGSRFASGDSTPPRLRPETDLAQRLAAFAAEPPPTVVRPPAPVLEPLDSAAGPLDPARLAEIDRILEEALEDSVFTAAAVAVGRRGGIAHLRGYGGADPSTTLFDLASLTKVVGTATAAALLVDRGALSLDAPVLRYLPEWGCADPPCSGPLRGGGRGEVTVRHLLSHTAGLPAGLWVYGSARSPEQALRQILRQPLVREPGERATYSDLGPILLAEVVERAARTPIDRLLAGEVFAPLGMQHTLYLPPVALREAVVPTASGTEREFTLQGVVHDANAFRLGGVAGHAGLFSTARDLAVFAQMLINGGTYGDVRVLSEEVVQTFRRRQSDAHTRALGWDTPSPRSSAGRFFSTRSFGHTGYTGTSLWIDPERDLFVVLLTNRTFPKTSAREVLRLRAAVHDAAVRAFTPGRPAPRRGSR